MDELSTIGETQIWTTTGDASTIDPVELGLAAPELSELQGGEADENAEILKGILDGSLTGPKRDLVTLNSAAGLVICGKASNLAEGLTLANDAINSRRALEVLHRWQNFS